MTFKPAAKINLSSYAETKLSQDFANAATKDKGVFIPDTVIKTTAKIDPIRSSPLENFGSRPIRPIDEPTVVIKDPTIKLKPIPCDDPISTKPSYSTSSYSSQPSYTTSTYTTSQPVYTTTSTYKPSQQPT